MTKMGLLQRLLFLNLKFLKLSPPLSCSQMQSLSTSNYTCGMGDAPVGSGSWHKINQCTYTHTSIPINTLKKYTMLPPPSSISLSDHKTSHRKTTSFITIVRVRMVISIHFNLSLSLSFSLSLHLSPFLSLSLSLTHTHTHKQTF